MENILSIVMAIAMISAVVLAIGGVRLTLDRHSRTRGILMIAASLVLIMNVMIWTV